MPMMATVGMLFYEALKADEDAFVAERVGWGAIEVADGECEEEDGMIDTDVVVKLYEIPSDGGRTEAGATKPNS